MAYLEEMIGLWRTTLLLFGLWERGTGKNSGTIFFPLIQLFCELLCYSVSHLKPQSCTDELQTQILNLNIFVVLKFLQREAKLYKPCLSVDKENEAAFFSVT